jgi:hypothetical protein
MPRNSQKTARPKPKPRRRQGGKGKPFPRGTSGNPTGRPPLTAEQKQDREVLTTRARELTPDVLERWYEIAMCGTGMPAIRAGENIVDRAWGRPRQSVELEANVGGGLVIGLPPENPEG